MKTFEVLGKIANEEKSNLTELNAMNSIVKGYWEHPDWMAHLFRYGFAAKILEKERAESVLDVGSGRLNLAHYLWRNRYSYPSKQYTALDLGATEEWLKYVTEPKFDIRLIKMNLLNYPIIGQFPVVVCFETLEHIPRHAQQLFIDWLFGCTAPNGVCLLSSPNAGVTKTTAENHIGPDGESRERTYDEKFEMCLAAGFKVEKTYGAFTAVTRIKPEVLENPTVQAMKEFLPYPAFCAAIAAVDPRGANNAVYQLRSKA